MVDGECIINYSIKMEYYTDTTDEIVKLINTVPADITEMIIDDKVVKSNQYYVFENIGKHIIYISIDISNTFSDICFIK